jgi:hypothetical protein
MILLEAIALAKALISAGVELYETIAGKADIAADDAEIEAAVAKAKRQQEVALAKLDAARRAAEPE